MLEVDVYNLYYIIDIIVRKGANCQYHLSLAYDQERQRIERLANKDFDDEAGHLNAHSSEPEIRLPAVRWQAQSSFQFISGLR